MKDNLQEATISFKIFKKEGKTFRCHVFYRYGSLLKFTMAEFMTVIHLTSHRPTSYSGKKMISRWKSGLGLEKPFFF